MNNVGEIADLGEGVLGASVAVLLTVRNGAAVWVQSVTLVNTDAVSRTCNVYINRSGTRRRISPKDLTVRSGYMVELDSGYSLQAGDTIEASASAPDVIEWTLNGFERAA